jgi:hypothetical protein
VHGGRPGSGVDLVGTPYSGDALARKVLHVLADQALRAFAARDSAPTSLHSE